MCRGWQGIGAKRQIEAKRKIAAIVRLLRRWRALLAMTNGGKNAPGKDGWEEVKTGYWSLVTDD